MHVCVCVHANMAVFSRLHHRHLVPAREEEKSAPVVPLPKSVLKVANL